MDKYIEKNKEKLTQIILFYFFSQTFLTKTEVWKKNNCKYLLIYLKKKYDFLASIFSQFFFSLFAQKRPFCFLKLSSIQSINLHAWTQNHLCLVKSKLHIYGLKVQTPQLGILKFYGREIHNFSKFTQIQKIAMKSCVFDLGTKFI